MTFPVWIEVVCTCCNNTAAGQFTVRGQIPVRAMKNEAKAAGFVFNYNKVFCSQDCADDWWNNRGGQFENNA